ncbi:MAG: hypothetical protein JW927_03015 [Deltaproteobacteria bacterium]|nr:hypothetical protein [Deltaproteobacteria bacterium]
MPNEALNNNEILISLHNRTEELYKRIDMQYALMEELINNRVIKRNFTAGKSVQENEREKKLLGALKETIEILEQTKKSFKSKRLELLRKMLTEVLIDY